MFQVPPKPPIPEVLEKLVERAKQGDGYAYFEILELYSDPHYRPQVAKAATTPVDGKRLNWRADWEGLRASDPPRAVRMKLLSMAVRGRDEMDPRNDWMAIEQTADYAKEHNVTTGPILDEVSALSQFMAEEIKRRRHLFETGLE